MTGSIQWRTFSVMLWICGVISSDPEFVAPVNPCRTQDVICPLTCNLMKMSGSTNCEFCFCTNPIDSVAWPDTTTITSTTASTTTTLPPGHFIVNNIHYVELRNPCILSNAMCPTTCIRRNVTLSSGRTCERCECPDIHSRPDSPQSALIGRREWSKASLLTEKIWKEDQVRLVRQHMQRHPGPEMMPHAFWNRPCMPFFTCPIFTCPPGQHMPVTPSGCRMCQCVITQASNAAAVTPITDQPSTTSETTEPPTTIDPASFLEMFCLPKADYCPSACHVTNYRVGSWDCYHCSCPEGQTFIALQKPCDENSYVCPSNCSIRNEEDFSGPTTSCQICDCKKSSSAPQRRRKFLFGPSHNSHVAYSGPVQGGNVFDMSQSIPFGFNPSQGHIYGTSSQGPVHYHVDLPTTTVEQAHTIAPVINCLTDADDCPTEICNLRTIGLHCHLCQCGSMYFRDSDVGKFGILNTRPSTEITKTTLVSILSTMQPPSTTSAEKITTAVLSSDLSTTPAPSVAVSSTQMPFTSITTSPVPSVVDPVSQTITTSQTFSATSEIAYTSCYSCNETDCKADGLKTCAVGKNYCMNTIIQKRNGAREFSRECVGEEECYDKWWIQSMNNPVCLDMYNNEKGPSNQPVVCHFCCKGPSCNHAARIEDYKLYTGSDHVIG
ncbi:uncharacterized protein LOC132563140 [Ylistrum balloti]|uniref:uncharacterized protein LOC132563140 n=1 Tax=Ylistrum balloti TaxID=509963 RepID=UPI002905EE0A|nr:uncharacterized protein LOC132563140 [Ylistrum balloti]